MTARIHKRDMAAEPLHPSSFILHPSEGLLAGVPYQRSAPLAPYTTWRVGGPADYLVLPRHVEDVRAALRFAQAAGLPWTAIGCGSNLLVADAGVAGVVIRLAENFSGHEFAGAELRAQAGASLPRLARAAVERGLAGLEFAVNIPGAVGGGVYMNAGCFGGCVSDVLADAEVLAPDGEIATRTPAQLGMRYRHTDLMDSPAIVLGARFRLEPGDRAALLARADELRRRRRLSQPPGSSAGSVFRNPEGERSAGWLIEQAGGKGLRCGQAAISDHHANFLLNLGGATAAQIHALILGVQARVRECFGVELSPEVRILGDVHPGDELVG